MLHFELVEALKKIRADSLLMNAAFEDRAGKWL
jgi:hypothetical protein